MLIFETGKLLLLLLFLLLVLFSPGKELFVDNDTRCRRGRLERGILYISGLIAEDSAQELLFRRRVALSFGRNLTNQDITFPYPCPDADDTVFVKIPGCIFADIGDIIG